MALLDVLHYPDPRLKQVSVPVSAFDDALRRFVADLGETMAAAPGCVGLAAPQCNRFQRIAIVDCSLKPKIRHNGRLVLINPEIVDKDGESLGREGCLSVPDFTGNVVRAQTLRLRARDMHGEVLEYACEGYEARAVQHEIDHLDGLLFLDKVVSAKDVFRRKSYK